MDVNPKISVIIPTYNRAKLLRSALNSVITQSCPVFEIIVVDDGSTDDTREYVTGLSCSAIKYIYKNNAGVSSARNVGLREATGEWIAFLDSDDVWSHKKIENFQNQLFLTPSLEFVFTNYIVVDPSTQNERYINLNRINIQDKESIMNSHIKTSSVLVKKCLMEKVGGFFHEDMLTGEDFELFWRLILDSNRMSCIDSYDTKIIEYANSLSRGCNRRNLIVDNLIGIDRVRVWAKKRNIAEESIKILNKKKYREVQALFADDIKMSFYSIMIKDMCFSAKFVGVYLMLRAMTSILIAQMCRKYRSDPYP